MQLRVPSGRPLARLVVGAYGHRRGSVPESAPTYSPPAGGRESTAAGGEADEASVELARAMLGALLAVLPSETGDSWEHDLAIDPTVVVWSPTISAGSREELVTALRARHDEDDALTDVHLAIDGSDVVGPRVYLEWHLTGRFTNAALVADDLLIEPTGRLVETSGVQVATFRAGTLTRIHCYYNDLALLEQLVTG